MEENLGNQTTELAGCLARFALVDVFTNAGLAGDEMHSGKSEKSKM